MFFSLYIDPGTGSMLFSLIIGLVAAGSFGLRALYLKFKFIVSGGNKESNIDNKKIPYVIFSDHKRYWKHRAFHDTWTGRLPMEEKQKCAMVCTYSSYD